MNIQLYQAARQVASCQGEDASWRAPLYALATEPPRRLAVWLWRGLLMVAALLLGVGLIFWIAANWQAYSRGLRLGLIEVALIAALAVACLLPRTRTAALLCATLALGGLLAFIGQTYQTGADAWQLFATWAALSLLWVLAQRSDLLWTLWVAVAALALALWTGPQGLLHWWNFGQRPPWGLQGSTMLAWLALAAVPTGVACVPWLRLTQGLGRWSHRLAVALALATWVGLAILGLLDHAIDWPGWLLAALLVAAVLGASLYGRWRDLPSLALATLAANVLVLSLATRLLFEGMDSGYSSVSFSLLSVLGLACLGGSATWLLRQQRKEWA